jgi:hypothetical protein
MQVAMNQDRPDLDTLAAVIVTWKVTNVFHSRRALAFGVCIVNPPQTGPIPKPLLDFGPEIEIPHGLFHHVGARSI